MSRVTRLSRIGQAFLPAAALLCFFCQAPVEYTDPDYDLIEFESVWQYCKAWSIYQDSAIYENRIPPDPFAFLGQAPDSIMAAIRDTLEGTRYTHYIKSGTAGSSLSAPMRFQGATVFLDTLTASTALLTITSFEATTFDEFLRVAAAAALFPNLVVDLRNNTGGQLDVLDSIICAMLPAGTAYICARERDFDQDAKQYVTLGWHNWTTERGPMAGFAGKRYAVLMDRNTASASEIMAAAIYEYCHAPLIGDTTYGKGMGQIQLIRRTRRMLQITFLQLRGVSPRIGLYQNHEKGIPIGISPDSIPSGTKQEGSGLNSLQRPFFYAVKSLEPGIAPGDIRYPSVRKGLSAVPPPRCFKTITEPPLFR